MNHSFIQRKLFIMIENVLKETNIKIKIPKINNNGLFECEIIFSDVHKYDAKSKGIDEFNAVESALDYVRAICNNSNDPEFFLNESESMKGFFP